MKTFILAALLLSTTGLYAGDENCQDIKNFGFSNDDRYFAFGHCGEGEGSGCSYSALEVINVAGNDHARRLQNHLDSSDGGCETTTPEQALERLVAEANLSSLGFGATARQGQELFRAESNHNIHNASFTLPSGSEYEVVLNVRQAPPSQDTVGDENALRIFTLTLRGKSGAGQNVNVVLQQDTRLPRSRFGAEGYGIRRVYKSGNSIAVIVSYYHYTFEAMGYSDLAVTGSVQLP